MLRYVTPSVKRRIDGKTYTVFPSSFFDREIVVNMPENEFREYIKTFGNVLTI